jgi:hypothetical protein
MKLIYEQIDIKDFPSPSCCALDHMATAACRISALTERSTLAMGLMIIPGLFAAIGPCLES